MDFRTRGNVSPLLASHAWGLCAAFAVLVFLPGSGKCQSPLKPSDFDLAYQTGSPAAEALGGAYLLSLKGPEAGAANPAQVNNDKRVAVTLGAVASTTNINVNNTEALINQLNDLNSSSNNGASAR